MNSRSDSTATGPRHASPHLGIVAAVYVVLKIGSVYPVSSFGSKPPYFPGLNASTETVVSYFSTHSAVVLLSAFLQVGAAIPFAIFAACMLSRFRFFGATVAGPLDRVHRRSERRHRRVGLRRSDRRYGAAACGAKRPDCAGIPLFLGGSWRAGIYDAVRPSDGRHINREGSHEDRTEMAGRVWVGTRGRRRIELVQHGFSGKSPHQRIFCPLFPKSA